MDILYTLNAFKSVPTVWETHTISFYQKQVKTKFPEFILFDKSRKIYVIRSHFGHRK